MKELEFVSADVLATDKEWEEFENRDDLYEFYCSDTNIVYVLREKVEK